MLGLNSATGGWDSQSPGRSGELGGVSALL
jgi:hypothetical protein